MPFKEEDYIDNTLNIKIYHDVLYDNEIEKIISTLQNDVSEQF